MSPVARPLSLRAALLFGLAALALFAALLTINAAAAEGELQVEIHSIDDATQPATAIITVIGEDGRPLTGLQATQLTLDDSGNPVTLLALEPIVDTTIGVAVVLLIDSSESMAGASIEQARNSAKTFVAGLSPNDSAAIISFASEIQVTQPLTSDSDALQAALDQIEAVGATALYDAVVVALDEAATSTFPYSIVVLLSDGEDFAGASVASREEALGSAATAGIPIYAIGFGPEPDENFLAELAAQSNGRLLVAPQPEDITAAYEELASLLRSQYIVHFEASTPPEVRTRELTITVATAEGTGIGRHSYETAVPLPPPPTPAATAPPVVATPVAVQAASELPPVSEGSSISRTAVIAMIAVIVVFAFALLARRWWLNSTEDFGLAGIDSASLPLPTPSGPSTASRRSAELTVIAGPDTGSSASVSEGLITIGGSPSCTIRLSAESDSASEEQARIWWRDDKLMFHHIGRSARTIIAGRPTEWATLDSGDILDIGAHRIEVLISQRPAATSVPEILEAVVAELELPEPPTDEVQPQPTPPANISTESSSDESVAVPATALAPWREGPTGGQQ